LPHVIGYRTSPITYALAKRLVRIPHIGLVNVVAGHEVSQEFVQDAFEPQRVADALLPLLETTDPSRERALSALASVREQLGTPGASGRVAEMILSLCEARP
jgi:lipid-A-disaccharide synthase